MFSDVLGCPPPSHDNHGNMFSYLLRNLGFPRRDDIMINPHSTHDHCELGGLLPPAQST